MIPALVWVAALSAAPPPAATSTTAAEQILVVGRRLDPTRRPLGLDGTLDLTTRPLALETLGSLVAEVPGASVFRQGGLGASELLSLRGADFDQTAVVVDDVPLVGPDRGAVDFGLVPLAGFERVEVFRGGAPLRYGGGTIGGVVRLVPRSVGDNRISAHALGASFGTFDTGVEGQAYVDAIDVVASAGYRRADNDFVYLDDNATFANPDDDTLRTLDNAALEQGNGFALLRWAEGAHQLTGLGLLVHQRRGLPGPAKSPSADSDQERTRAFASAGYRFAPLEALELHASAALGHDRDRVRDPFGRIGLSSEDTDDRYWSGSLRGGLSWDLLPPSSPGQVVLAALGLYRRDRAERANRLAAGGSVAAEPSSREELQGGLEATARLALGRWSGALSASGALRRSEVFTRGEVGGSDVDTAIERVAPHGRVALSLDRGAVGLYGQLATGLRVPTSLELLGNRDTVVGNPRLEPERSTTAELGLKGRADLGPLSGRAELRGFVLDVSDIIVARRTALDTVTFRNERRGTTWGVEAWLDLDWADRVRSTTSLTRLDARFDNQGFDRAQPLRVPTRLFQRLRGRLPLSGLLRELSLWAELDHRSAFFADSANLVRLPALTTFGLGGGLRLWEERVALSVAVRNLFDALGQDLLGFPRPGRRFEVGIEVTEWLP